MNEQLRIVQTNLLSATVHNNTKIYFFVRQHPVTRITFSFVMFYLL